MSPTSSALPIAVIGAGPVGLAAAARLAAAAEPFVILEAGAAVAASIRSWGHVRLFSPWRYNLDNAATNLLAESGWSAPSPDGYPTGAELIDQYLAPLAALPAIAPHIRLGTRVESIARAGLGKLKSGARDESPFALTIRTGEGPETRLLARAVIDASGTYGSPNPLGADGVPAAGERDASAYLFYGIPDVLGRERERYAGKRVLVVGGGHSAFNAILDLAALAETGISIHWAVRSAATAPLLGGGAADQLPARGELGSRVRRLVEQGRLFIQTGFHATRVEQAAGGLVVSSDDFAFPPVDEIIVTTGFRPDLSMTRELRLGLDEIVESPVALAPLIDPNIHSCGTVPPHGAAQLRHPEPNFYSVGMKSYGRAPTFLMLTGYEQVRSVVAALTGDSAGANEVRLVLPETGVCGGPSKASEPLDPVGEDQPSGCCGGPAAAGVDACCVKDADAKAAGESGCGCGTPAEPSPSLTVVPRSASCC